MNFPSMMGGGTAKLGGIKDDVVLMVVGGCHFPSCISIFVDNGESDLLRDLDRVGGLGSGTVSFGSGLTAGASLLAGGLLLDEEVVR